MKYPHLKAPLIYKLGLPPAADIRDLIELHQFHDLTPAQLSGHGFVKDPITAELVTPLTDGRTGYWIVMKYAERIIPGSVVKQLLAERIAEIELEEQRKVYAKERNQLREDIRVGIAPTALIRVKLVHGFYHAPSKHLFLSGASGKLASLFTGELVRVVGAVKAETVHFSEVSQGLTARLSAWLSHQWEFGESDAFGDFTIGNMVHISVPGKRQTATKIQADDLAAPSLGLQMQIDGGYFVDKIEMRFKDTEFYLDRGFRLSGMNYPLESLETDDLPYALRHEAGFRLLILADLVAELTEMLIPAKQETEVSAEVDDLL
jgi:recombination associated protein RdgC